MRRASLLAPAVLLSACATGRIVEVDPIYEPVQQVHQTFYRDKAFVAKGKKIAVMDFKGDAGVGQVFADTLAAELFNGGYLVAERQNVALLLQEMKMAESGAQKLTDTQILQKLGQMADVDVVIVGGVVTYKEEVQKLEFAQSVVLPFAIYEDKGAQPEQQRIEMPQGWTLYRWRAGKYKTPAGLPVQANIYASARGIEVATGKIVWIDTVNVQTSGITSVTGLERLGKVMAGNFGATFDDSTQMFIHTGEKFTYPANWEDVKNAWQTFQRQRGQQ